jgi:hypothetical protein
VVGIAAAIAVVAGCEDVTVPNYNNPSVDALTSSPTPSVVNTATSGLLVLYRAATATEGWQMGVGRESYNLLQAEARNLLASTPVQSCPAVSPRIRVVQRVHEPATDSVDTHGRRQGLRIQRRAKGRREGFVQTIAAMELLRQIKIRDTIGIVVDIPADPHSLGNVVARTQRWRASPTCSIPRGRICKPGNGVSICAHERFAGFNTPATFILVNRGTRACGRVPAAMDASPHRHCGVVRRHELDVVSDSRRARTTSGVRHRATRRIHCLIHADGAVRPSVDHERRTETRRRLARFAPDTENRGGYRVRSLQGVTGTTKFTIYAS